MAKPVLVIMAAGMGSRYGGLKQIDPVGPNGEVIIDYSIYDAMRAGFEKIVFIIKHEIEEPFKEAIGKRIEKVANVEYAFQQLDDLPEGFCPPEGRVKPWGTAQAILCADSVIDGPFAVINADDYYGPNAFKTMYEYLSNSEDAADHYEYAMMGYLLENTLTDNGHVARGVSTAGEDGYLQAITERTHIEKTEAGARFTEDDGKTWEPLAKGTLVSMNFWGLRKSFIAEIRKRFPKFLEEAIETNPMKGEYLLPGVINELLAENKAKVKVLDSKDKWYGVTYHDDKPVVMAAIAAMHKSGLYPEPLWGNQ